MNKVNAPSRLTPEEIRSLASGSAFESESFAHKLEDAVHAKWQQALADAPALDYEALLKKTMAAMSDLPSLRNSVDWKGWPGTWAFASVAVNTLKAFTGDCSGSVSVALPVEAVGYSVYQGNPIELVRSVKVNQPKPKPGPVEAKLTSTEKRLYEAVFELRFAVSDLASVVSSLAWGSSSVSVHDSRLNKVYTTLDVVSKVLQNLSGQETAK